MQNVSITLVVSSDQALGATNVNTGVSRFSVQFKNTIEIPDDAQNITLQCTQATIFWTVLNIIEGINDLFQLEVSGDAVYIVTLEAGLYDVSGLNNAVNNNLVNQGLAAGLVSIIADNATQKILLSFTTAGLQVKWVAQSFFKLVGFNSLQSIPAGGFTLGSFSELAPNIADFSDVSSFLLHTSLVHNGIPLGDTASQALSQILINVRPGSQINFNPFNPIKLNVDHLRGQTINEASFWITDQLNRTLDFNGQFFSALVVIKYYLDDIGVTHI